MKRPVLLLGWIPRIIVPVARSLCRRGIPVDVASFAPTPRIPSRAISEFRSVPRPDIDQAEFVGQMRRFIAERGHDLLLFADDWMLTAVMEHYDEFKDLAQIGCPPPAITRLVLDKIATLKVAQACGIEVPRTEVVASSSELNDLVGRFPFPWVVKPAQKETRIEEVKSCRVTTSDEVAARFSAGRKFEPAMLAQQFCAGIGVGVEMLMYQGECIASFQHRRLKESPYTGGVSVIAVAEAVNRDLMQSSLALLRALQWEGVAMVEYKVDADGRAVLMEVNGRYWGTISLPIFAGVDFPWYHWQLVHGERPQIPTTYSIGTKWRWTAGYFERLYGVLARTRRLPGAREVFWDDFRRASTDFSPSVYDATFSLSDPAPAIADFLRTMSYVVSH